MGKILAIIRLIIWGLALLIVVPFMILFSLISHKISMWLRKIWCQLGNLILGVRIERTGNYPKDGTLFAANHRSFYDPIIFLSRMNIMPVSKAEVRKYPLAGIGLHVSGTIFVQRENKDSRTATKKAIVEGLKNGSSIVLFPEGTTTDLPLTKEFKKGAFLSLENTGLPVVPVAIEYRNPDQYYVGDDTVLSHFMRCFCKWKTEVKLHYGEPFLVEDGIAAKERCQSEINEKLKQFHKEWGIKRNYDA